MDDLVHTLEKRLSTHRWRLEQADDLQYRMRLSLRHPATSDTIDLIYNGDRKVTRVIPVGSTLAERERQKLIGILETTIKSWNEDLMLKALPEHFTTKYLLVQELVQECFSEEPDFLGVDNYAVRVRIGNDSLALYHDGSDLWTAFHWNAGALIRVPPTPSPRPVLIAARSARDQRLASLRSKSVGSPDSSTA